MMNTANGSGQPEPLAFLFAGERGRRNRILLFANVFRWLEF